MKAFKTINSYFINVSDKKYDFKINKYIQQIIILNIIEIKCFTIFSNGKIVKNYSFKVGFNIQRLKKDYTPQPKSPKEKEQKVTEPFISVSDNFVYTPKPNKEIQEMSIYDKLKIYIHYLNVCNGLKFDFHIVDTRKENWQHGFGVPDKIIGDYALYYLAKDLTPMSFEYFLTPSVGYHQYSPIDTHYVKFKDQITL